MAVDSDATSVHRTLVASTVDTVRLTGSGEVLRVSNRGTADIWYRVEKGTTPSDPAAATKGSYYLPAGAVDEFPDDAFSEGDWAVKLISASTPAYSVELLP